MAVQFPNFLGVPIRTGQYDALGDIVQNYYAGKSMPKDDLIKAIQAEFARPNAEQSLLASKLGNSGKRLSNQKEQLDINKMMQDMADQKAFEQQLRQALGGGATGANPSMGGANGASSQPMNMPPAGMPMRSGGAPSPVQMNPALSQALGQSQGQSQGVQNVDVGEPDAYGLDPSKMDRRYVKIDQQATGLPASAYGKNASAATANPASAPASPMAMAPQAASQEQPNEIVVAKGSPHLSGVDAMYENSPLSRAFLEKKGYKKQTEVKFDNKTGRTTVMTKYPSGKVTLQTMGGAGSVSGDGIPLTNNQVTKHQNIISSVDVAIPVLKEIADMKSYPYNPLYHGAEYADYHGLVSQALDSVVGAFGMPKTNEGLESVRSQIERKTFETAGAYRKRLNKLISDLEKRKNYSAGEVKRSNKISPVSSSDTSSIQDDDPVFGGDDNGAQ